MTTEGQRAGVRWRGWLVSIPIALAVAVVAPTPAHPQETPAAPEGAGADVAELVNGEWRLAISESAAQGRIERAIEDATRQMLPIVSGIAAGRLRDANRMSPTIGITVDPRRVRIEFEHATFETAPGHPRRMPRPGHESEMIEVTQLVREGHLEQIFTNEDGRRWNTFQPSPDGQRLELGSVLQSTQLPQPMRYTIPYERAR